MKKLFGSILIFVLFLTNLSFATTSEHIEFQSGEQDDGAIYLDSYEDYEDALKDVDEQEVYKESYEIWLNDTIRQYNEMKSENTVKAKVLEAGKVEEYYFLDENYISNKIKYQPITVQILEGEYKNQVFETSYILKIDKYENINLKEVKANQTVNVIVTSEEGNLIAYVTTADSSISRAGVVVFLIIVAIIMLAVYLRKDALKILPQIILIADLIFLIFVPETIAGKSIIWLTIVSMLLYLISNTTIKLGLNAKMAISIFSTIAVVVVSTILLIGFNSLASMSGILYEAVVFLDSFPSGTVDFYNLNLAIYILMSTIIVSDISCEIIKNDNASIKEYVSNKLLTAVVILLLTMLPKFLYFLVVKYSYTEIINSEIFLNEIIRILFIIISATASTSVVRYAKKIFLK